MTIRRNAMRQLEGMPRVDLPARLAQAQSSLLERLPGSRDFIDAYFSATVFHPLRDFVSRPSKGVRQRLVENVWAIVRGSPAGLPADLAIVVEALHAGSLIIDDIQDGSPERRGGPTLERIMGLPLALNTGCWLYFWAATLLDELAVTSPQHEQLSRRFHQCIRASHEGQALDLAGTVLRIPKGQLLGYVRSTTLLKTASLSDFAARSGAIVAGATNGLEERFAAYGAAFGTVLQMLDDLSGVLVPARRQKGIEDLRLGRPTWNWAWLSKATTDGEFCESLERLERVMTDSDQSEAEALREVFQERLAHVGLQEIIAASHAAVAALAPAIGRGPYETALLDEIHNLRGHYGLA